MNNEEIRQRLEEGLGCEVEIMPSRKLERLGEDTFVVGSKDTFMKPTLYANDITEDNIDEIIESTRAAIDKAPDMSIGDISDWDKCRDKLRLCAGPHLDDPNNTYLSEQVLNIDKYVRLDFDTSSARVANKMIEQWKKTPEEIFKVAAENTRYMHMPLERYLRDVIGLPIPDEDIGVSGLHLITAENWNCYGASAIFSQDILDEVANEFNGDVVIIPSSIEELLALPMSALDSDYVNDMIKSVNSEVLEDEKFLSDNAYIYKRESRSLECMM